MMVTQANYSFLIMCRYQGIVLVLTFQVYMSYHLSRVSVGVVKVRRN